MDHRQPLANKEDERFTFLAAMLSMMGCCDTHTSVTGAKDPTPIRYVICGNGESKRLVSARFKGMDGCESHKAWPEMLCDSKSTLGMMICKTETGAQIATTYCTF